MKYSILSLTSLFILLAFTFKKNTPLMVQEEDQITWMSIEQAEEACKKKPKKIVTTQVLSCGKNGPEFPLTKMVILSKKSMIENMPLESNGLYDQ